MGPSRQEPGSATVGRSAEHVRLQPYVPRILVDWLSSTPEAVHREVEGTLLFADISGFTKLTERLARMGRVGAEEMSDALNATFGQLLTVAAVHGADLVKWGGDAVLLVFDGADHAGRACRTAYDMRARLRAVGRLTTSAGQAHLRMSQGIHTGRIQFFLVGDPALHRELLVCGPDVSEVVALEGAANAGQIAVGATTCALLDQDVLGTGIGPGGRLLRRRPEPVGEMASTMLLPRQRSVDLAVGLPTAIRQHLLLGPADPEHRSIAVGFVAFSGTDAMLAARGPEATADALDACIRNVASAVEDHGVTFFESDINADGGKIMLTAGAPTSAGHDAERLLRAARLIVERAGDLPLRVGVNTGHVFAGDFGPAVRRTYSVKGDAINLAARLVARAAPGQVLATTRVVDQSATRFATEALAPFAVKGKKRPVTALDVGPVAEAQSGGPQRASGPLVGRGTEVEALTAALEQVRERRGELVQIVGDAGIGKSRLLAETAARAEDLTVLSVQCDEYESSTPYHTFRLLLRRLLGIRSGADPAAAADRLAARVAADAPELLPWLPLVASVAGVPLADTEETRELEGEFRKRRLEIAVGSYLHAILPTPTVVLVDDGQFLDGASADLLAHLVSRMPDDPWLVVVARRDGSEGTLPTGSGTTLRPQPLSTEESIRLLQGAPDGQPLPRPTAAALAARAAGNPLFLESLRDAAGPSARHVVLELPLSVQELVTGQIDRLTPSDRTVLRRASVLGMRFSLADLAELADGAAPDGSTCRRLDRFLVEDGAGRYRFRHGLMRDIAYAGLPFRTRRQLHEGVAERLERSVAEVRPELLSLHFFHAGNFEKAWRYSTEAGRHALAKFANHEAIELLTRAVDAERRCPPGSVPPADLGRVLEDIGDTWFVIGLPEQAADAYRRARRQFDGDPVQAARIVAKEARIDHRLRHLPQSLRRVSRALHQLEQVPGRWASSARSLLAMRYAISRFSQGRLDEAIAWGQRAARDAEESVDKATLAQAYGTLHGIYVTAGLEPPMPYGELSLQAYTELGDLPHQADCINNLAVSALEHNRWIEAAESFGRAAGIYRQIGDTYGEGLAIYNRADVLLRQGRLRESRSLLDDALVAARSVSDDELVALCLRETGRVLCRQGDVAAGSELIEQARVMFVEIEEPEELPATDVALAEASLIDGDLAAVLAATEAPLTADDPATPVQHRVRGFALLAVGRPLEAELEFRAGVAGALEQGNLYARALNLLGLAALDVMPGFAEEAALVLQQLGVVAVPLGSATLEALHVEGLAPTSI